jgi:hypothetical protein
MRFYYHASEHFMRRRVLVEWKTPIWRYRLTVRTEPSQGLNTGSIPVSATNSSITYGQRAATRSHQKRASMIHCTFPFQFSGLACRCRC